MTKTDELVFPSLVYTWLTHRSGGGVRIGCGVCGPPSTVLGCIWHLWRHGIHCRELHPISLLKSSRSQALLNSSFGTTRWACRVLYRNRSLFTVLVLNEAIQMIVFWYRCVLWYVSPDEMYYFHVAEEV